MTLQFLFPMGGLGTRFAQVGIPTPKPLIPVDGNPMILKALSSFDELLHMSGAHEGTESLAVRVVFVIRSEHEQEFGLRTQLRRTFERKYGCNEFWSVNDNPSSANGPLHRLLPSPPSEKEETILSRAPFNDKMSVYFVMMHADTRGAAETCLLAQPALLLEAPVVILDCDLYVYSSTLNRVLRSMALKGKASSEKEALGQEAKGSSRLSSSHSISSDLVEGLRGALVFFNSRAPRYSYAVVEPIEGLDLSDPTGKITAGGRVTKTAEKVPISNCSLIGAYTFATAGWFVAAAKALIEQPLNPTSGLKEYYISLLYNFLLDPAFKPEGFESLTTTSESTTAATYVLAVPKEQYSTFGTPDELKSYEEGKESYALE